MNFDLAQFNIARGRASLDSKEMADFVNQIAFINELAESSPGFVWRLTDEGGGSSSYIETDLEGDNMLINLSTWRSIDDLKNFTYKSLHRELIKNKAKWFYKLGKPHLVMWWVPQGHEPSIEEAIERLKYLESHGESEHAFTFKNTFFPAV